MSLSPSPGNAISVEIRYENTVGKLSEISKVIAEVGGDISLIDVITTDRKFITRRFRINAASVDHAKQIEDALRAVAGAEVLDVYDCTFKVHEGGKITVESTCKVDNADALSMAYTPGVARVCKAIQAEPALADKYTIKGHTVAVVTDGTAVLGLGSIGAGAGMPVMEGKAVLFKEFGGVDAFPICLDVDDPKKIIECTKALEPNFGGINLEDIKAPACFEVERELTKMMDIPVFHDDQHGTATVVGAAFLNAIRLTGKKPENIRLVVSGAGAAGLTCTRILQSLGIKDIIVCNSKGTMYDGKPGLTVPQQWLAERTNAEKMDCSLKESLKGADMFLGLSVANILTREDILTMNKDPFIFSLANPTPEGPPEEVADYASIIATGRSDYANQINNVLCFPGLFKGLLTAGAKKVTREMQLAACHAIANVIPQDELRADYIIPSVFDERVSPAVSEAVYKIATDPNAPQTPLYFEF